MNPEIGGTQMIAYRNSSVAGYMDSCYVDQATDQQIRECLEEYPR